MNKKFDISKANREFLDAVDIVCMNCGEGTDEICVNCPVRHTVDNIYTAKEED